MLQKWGLPPVYSCTPGRGADSHSGSAKMLKDVKSKEDGSNTSGPGWPNIATKSWAMPWWMTWTSRRRVTAQADDI